jgi:phosphoribosylaminoimidazole-succinocarboxamide synthase
MIIKLDEKRQKMSQKQVFYEGAEKVYYVGNKDEDHQISTIILHFKDAISSAANKKISAIEGKGIINNRISAKLHTLLQEYGFPTYYIKTLNMREQVLAYVDPMPMRIRIRNIASPLFAEKFGMEPGRRFYKPIIEFLLKPFNEELLVSEIHAQQFIGVGKSDLDLLKEFAVRVSEFLSGYFTGLDSRLIDIKFRFGRAIDEEGDIYYLLCSELTPDTFNVWDYQTNEILSRERFEMKMKNPEKGYNEIATRMKILPEE